MRHFLLVMVLLLLSGCGKETPSMAGEKWAKALHAPDAKVRRKAAFTLGNIGPSDPAVLPALIGSLRDTDPGVRRETILALLKYGSEAKAAIQALTDVQDKDLDPKVREDAAKALEIMKGSQ